MVTDFFFLWGVGDRIRVHKLWTSEFCCFLLLWTFRGVWGPHCAQLVLPPGHDEEWEHHGLLRAIPIIIRLAHLWNWRNLPQSFRRLGGVGGGCRAGGGGDHRMVLNTEESLKISQVSANPHQLRSQNHIREPREIFQQALATVMVGMTKEKCLIL